MTLRWTLFTLLLAVTSGYQASRTGKRLPAMCFSRSQLETADSQLSPASIASRAVASAALGFLLLSSTPALASGSQVAAQISLDALPPTSISVQIGDLPVVGKLLSGTYTKIPEGSSLVGKPSITIKSPVDKVKAVSSIATAGHLEFDVTGALSTHLDVDVAADEPGVAKIRVSSNLIPKLPFKNLASFAVGSPTGGRESAWNVVTNLGSGESYYYNAKSGVTQMERPDKF